MVFAMESGRKKSMGVFLVFVLGFMFLASSLLFPPKMDTAKVSSTSVASSEFKNVEMNLAQVIYKYSRKDKNDKRITWNESQQKASKIVNMVLTGSDVASAISVVLGFFSFGTVTAIAWAARMTLKWYIKKKGRKKAVTW
ncbi:uberolysin/carnocyclin family circular bacteriocin [Aeribacillus pallidus]|uniref:Circularin A/uberolysin family circular bacteriocin n=1 Tax=Aeribacillus alveayuensis TaxID=279215 RepID=A0ABT9VSH0_9BACI|nr:circularin A/uberolysin family circular bacteriocin [Bacillus alveayuensis]MDR9797337.1 uberolysin/carnocyclin family circular bacteriocin [Aeribacillus pallidus]